MKHKIISVLYPEGLIYDGKNYLNDENNIFMMCIINKINEFKQVEEKKISENADLLKKVALTWQISKSYYELLKEMDLLVVLL